MNRRVVIGVLLATCLSSGVSAQSSQFGIRGLGHPGRAASAAAMGIGGATVLFDGMSSWNPAALGTLTAPTTVFTSTQSWRSTENPFGSASQAEHRFPQLLIGAPIGNTPISVALSYSVYMDRDFTLVSEGVATPRDEPIGVTDSIGSIGGISDLRMGLSFAPAPGIHVGAGLHFLTGSNRMFSRRAWADSSYLPERQNSEVSYAGIGLSAGVLLQPVSRLQIAGMVRRDGSLSVEVDSVRVNDVALPWTLAAGMRYRIANRAAVSAMISTRSWADASADLEERGGMGSRNTLEVAAGLELVRSSRRPDQLPLRLGVRHAQLPFLLVQGSQPRELGISAGTGFRFAGDLGGVDLAVERITRSQGDSYSENAWHLTVGVSLRLGDRIE